MQRAYREDTQCPHCASNRLTTAGLSHGKQNYRCGNVSTASSPKGYYSKTDGMLTLSIALGWLMLGGFSRPARVENALPRDWRRCLGDVAPSYPSLL